MAQGMVDIGDAVALASRAVDRGVTRCLTASDGDRRRAALVGVLVFVAAHLVPEVARYRSTLVDVDRALVDTLVDTLVDA